MSMTQDRRGIEFTNDCCTSTKYFCCLSFHRPGLGQKRLDSSPYLLLPACNGLIYSILLILEQLNHDRVINVSLNTTPGASIWVVLFVSVLAVFFGLAMEMIKHRDSGIVDLMSRKESKDSE